MFHAITEGAKRDWGPWRYTLTPSEFEAAVEHLVENRTVVTLADIVGWVRSGESIPNDAVAITFDDGYKDYSTNALPILREYNAPSVVYLSSSLVGPRTQSPFEFRLAYAIESQVGSTVSIDCLGFETQINTTTDIVNAYENIRPDTKYRDVKFRHAVLSSIGDNEPEPLPMLSASDVRSLASDPLVTCGSHGSDHVPFEILSASRQRANAQEASSQLAKLLDAPPKHFSFPYGSYNTSAVQTLRSVDIVSAVTTRPRALAPRDWDHPYTLPRVDGATTLLQE